jgi:hypothetical protein
MTAIKPCVVFVHGARPHQRQLLAAHGSAIDGTIRADRMPDVEIRNALAQCDIAGLVKPQMRKHPPIDQHMSEARLGRLIAAILHPPPPSSNRP